MKKIEGDPSLYERIENAKKAKHGQDDKSAFRTFRAFQDDLSLCNDLNNYGTEYGTPDVPMAFQDQESSPKTDPIPDPLPVSLDDQLMTFYTARLEAIASKYIDGCYDWLQQAKPELHTSLCRAFDRVNEVWKSTMAGVNTVADFEAAVTDWYNLELEAIRRYSEYIGLKKKMAAKCQAEQVKGSIPVCYACHESRWWVDHDGNRKCGTCHPAPKSKMVKEWL